MLDPLVARDENHPPVILSDNAGPQGAPSSMQDVAHRLLAALQAEGYGNATVAGDNANVGVISNELSRLSISSIQVRQESESSVMLGLKFDNEEWTSSFWNEGQSPVRPASFLDEPRVNQQEPVGALHQFSMPSITLNDGAITDKTLSVTQPSVTPTGSDSSGSKEANKGVTYPSRLDDIMVGISF
ncbi:hypothetical protein ACEPPN_000195 [Leptodophora sp. 'Broadleaf-Isolate-01']